MCFTVTMNILGGKNEFVIIADNLLQVVTAVVVRNDCVNRTGVCGM